MHFRLLALITVPILICLLFNVNFELFIVVGDTEKTTSRGENEQKIDVVAFIRQKGQNIVAAMHRDIHAFACASVPCTQHKQRYSVCGVCVEF